MLPPNLLFFLRKITTQCHVKQQYDQPKRHFPASPLRIAGRATESSSGLCSQGQHSQLYVRAAQWSHPCCRPPGLDSAACLPMDPESPGCWKQDCRPPAATICFQRVPQSPHFFGFPVPIIRRAYPVSRVWVLCLNSGCRRGWKNWHLTFCFECERLALPPTKTHNIGNSSNIGRSLSVGEAKTHTHKQPKKQQQKSTIIWYRRNLFYPGSKTAACSRPRTNSLEGNSPSVQAEQ